MSTQRTSSSGVGDVFTQNLGTGAAVGAVAYVVSYALTFVFVTLDGLEQTGEVATWKAVGWVFYAAHFVETEISISAAGQSQSETLNPLTDGSAASGITSTVPEFVYYLVPVAVLVAAGYVAATRYGGTLSTEAAAAAGASVIVGYLVLGVAGRFLVTESQSTQIGSASVGPVLVMSVVLLGIAYPVVCGALGGALSSQ
ncbi:hypothetical protein ACKVMT_16470 [Halobacteriales archaeon Cl-PHB]